MCEKNYLKCIQLVFSTIDVSHKSSRKNVDCKIESKVVVRNFRNSSAGFLIEVLEFRRKFKIICFQWKLFHKYRREKNDERTKPTNFYAGLIAQQLSIAFNCFFRISFTTGWKMTVYMSLRCGDY